jgi:hypothetical protein
MGTTELFGDKPLRGGKNNFAKPSTRTKKPKGAGQSFRKTQTRSETQARILNWRNDH